MPQTGMSVPPDVVSAEKSFYERAFTQCGHLWSEFPGVKQFTTSSRLANIARQFFRTKHVRLWHDQALYKLPGGSKTEPHQDMSYWPMLDRSAGTIWVALSEVTIDMGAMHFYPRIAQNANRRLGAYNQGG
ncbi:MAG: phytanoyl-CoA dioxygenase family protein [bacterium]